MINKEFKEFMEKENNIDFNYQKIKERTGKKYKIKKILNAVAVIFVIMLVGIGTNRLYAKRQWDIAFNNFQNREREFSTVGTKESAENGYTEYIDMNYVYQNNIGIKIDSIFITDDQFEVDLNFKFPEDMKVDSRYFDYGYFIYDENNKIYGFYTRHDYTSKLYVSNDYGYDYLKLLLKELGIEYNVRDGIDILRYNNFSSHGPTSINDRNIISKIEMESVKGFPKSKNLYIRLFNLGFTMTDSEIKDDKYTLVDYEDFRLSENTEWIFEIEVPERMYNRETINLKLIENIPNFKIDKLTITESKLLIKATMNKDDEMEEEEKRMWDDLNTWSEYLNKKVYITDNEGNIYNHLPTSMINTKDKFSFEYSFDINKNMLKDDTFYLNIKDNGILYTKELIVD